MQVTESLEQNKNNKIIKINYLFFFIFSLSFVLIVNFFLLIFKFLILRDYFKDNWTKIFSYNASQFFVIFIFFNNVKFFNYLVNRSKPKNNFIYLILMKFFLYFLPILLVFVFYKQLNFDLLFLFLGVIITSFSLIFFFQIFNNKIFINLDNNK
jgi:hypothetical protein